MHKLLLQLELQLIGLKRIFNSLCMFLKTVQFYIMILTNLKDCLILKILIGKYLLVL
jgi:hypothetical protein